MNPTKHTLSPWKAEIRPETQRGQFGASIRPAHSLVPMIAHIPVCDLTRSQWEANARLIAAAPDLLQACGYALECLDPSAGDEDCINEVRAAIAKAEGVPV